MSHRTKESRDALLASAEASLRRRGITIDEESLLGELERLDGSVSPILATDPLRGVESPTLTAARKVLALRGISDPSESDLADAAALVHRGLA